VPQPIRDVNAATYKTCLTEFTPSMDAAYRSHAAPARIIEPRRVAAVQLHPHQHVLVLHSSSRLGRTEVMTSAPETAYVMRSKLFEVTSGKWGNTALSWPD
jgi:hypothetical protein